MSTNEPQDPYGQAPEPGSQPEGQQGWGQQPQPPQGPQQPQEPQWGQQAGPHGGSSMGDGYSAPPPPPNYYGGAPAGAAFPSTEKNSLGVWALVLGILGVVSSCCGPVFGIPAIILGSKGKAAADRGLASNRGVAQAGLVLGWIGLAIGVLILLWFFFLGGWATVVEVLEEAERAANETGTQR